MTDMTNSEATKQPILPDTSTCAADQNDEPSKDSVIDYVGKIERNPYRPPAIEQGPSPFANVNILPWRENLLEFFTRKRRAFLVKAR